MLELYYLVGLMQSGRNLLSGTIPFKIGPNPPPPEIVTSRLNHDRLGGCHAPRRKGAEGIPLQLYSLIEWRGYTSHSICQPSAARVLGAESGQSSPAEFYSRCIHVRQQHSNQVNRWFKNSKVMLVRTIWVWSVDYVLYPACAVACADCFILLSRN